MGQTMLKNLANGSHVEVFGMVLKFVLCRLREPLLAASK